MSLKFYLFAIMNRGTDIGEQREQLEHLESSDSPLDSSMLAEPELATLKKNARDRFSVPLGERIVLPNWIRTSQISSERLARFTNEQNAALAAYRNAAVWYFARGGNMAVELRRAQKGAEPYIQSYYREILPVIAQQTYNRISMELHVMRGDPEQQRRLRTYLNNAATPRIFLQQLTSEDRNRYLPPDAARYVDPETAFGYSPETGWLQKPAAKATKQKRPLDFSPAITEHVSRVGAEHLQRLPPADLPRKDKESLKQYTTRLAKDYMERAIKDMYILAYLRKTGAGKLSHVIMLGMIAPATLRVLKTEAAQNRRPLTDLMKDMEDAVMDAASTRQLIRSHLDRIRVRDKLVEVVQQDTELRVLYEKETRKEEKKEDEEEKNKQEEEKKSKAVGRELEKETTQASYVDRTVPQGTTAHVLNDAYIEQGQWFHEIEKERMETPSVIVIRLGETSFINEMLTQKRSGQENVWDAWQRFALNTIDRYFPTTGTSAPARLVRRRDGSFGILMNREVRTEGAQELFMKLRLELQQWMQVQLESALGRERMDMLSRQRRLKKAMLFVMGKSMPEYIDVQQLSFLKNRDVLSASGLTEVQVARLAPQEAWVLSKALERLRELPYQADTFDIGEVQLGADRLYTDLRPKSYGAFEKAIMDIRQGMDLSAIQNDPLFVPVDKDVQKSQVSMRNSSTQALHDHAERVDIILQTLGLYQLSH